MTIRVLGSLWTLLVALCGEILFCIEHIFEEMFNNMSCVSV